MLIASSVKGTPRTPETTIEAESPQKRA